MYMLELAPPDSLNSRSVPLPELCKYKHKKYEYNLSRSLEGQAGVVKIVSDGLAACSAFRKSF